MSTIIQGQAADIAATLQTDGSAIAIAGSATVTAQLFSVDGATQLSSLKTLASSTPGANWGAGVVVAQFTSGDTGALPAGDVMMVVNCSSPAAVKRFRVTVEIANVMQKSVLFVRDFAVADMRRDRLVMAASGILPQITVTDDYLWDKLRAAEAEAQRDLRVYFQPTALFPDTPTDVELAALNGAPWAIDPGYDFGPENFYHDKWGMIITRQKPIISVSSVRMVYPSPAALIYEFPADWIRLDRKYGHIRLVPSSSLSLGSLSANVMQLFSSRMIPQAMQVRYVAGLENAAQDYPDLIDLVMKKAALKVIGDLFLPQSGSISADGLSQSFGADFAKYHESIDLIMNGPKGSNGGLMTAIHGARLSVLG
jgi:hypothetical protein